jgi:type IV pilus assembly protein PilP
VLLAAGARAQQPAATAAPGPEGQSTSAAATSAPGAKGPAAPAGAYAYNPDGRRDPFVSLLGRGSDPRSAGARPAGLPGILINELSIKGIIRDRSGFIAMVQGADNKTYVVRAGDRLMDGTVKSIVQDAVVFSQDVNDPLSLVKQKEIRKNLRSTEGSRG